MMKALDFLDDLPSSSDAFTRMVAQPLRGSESLPRYIPDPEAVKPRVEIQTHRTKCLIRALSAKPFVDPVRKTEHTQPNKPPAKRQREAESLSWSNLEKEQRQACLRVALAGACDSPNPSHDLVHMLSEWRENPRKKQKLTYRMRVDLAQSTSTWTMDHLRAYLERAKITPALSRAELVRQVRFHLLPNEPQI